MISSGRAMSRVIVVGMIIRHSSLYRITAMMYGAKVVVEGILVSHPIVTVMVSSTTTQATTSMRIRRAGCRSIIMLSRYTAMNSAVNA